MGDKGDLVWMTMTMKIAHLVWQGWQWVTNCHWQWWPGLEEKEQEVDHQLLLTGCPPPQLQMAPRKPADCDHDDDEREDDIIKWWWCQGALRVSLKWLHANQLRIVMIIMLNVIFTRGPFSMIMIIVTMMMIKFGFWWWKENDLSSLNDASQWWWSFIMMVTMATMKITWAPSTMPHNDDDHSDNDDNQRDNNDVTWAPSTMPCGMGSSSSVSSSHKDEQILIFIIIALTIKLITWSTSYSWSSKYPGCPASTLSTWSGGE